MRKEDAKLRKRDDFGSEPDPFRVGILALPGFALLSYASTVEPLRAANLLSPSPLYEITHFGAGAMVPSSGAAQLECTAKIGTRPKLDLSLIHI